MNFETTLNGHIHKHSVVNTSDNKVINVGSMTSMSFSDSNSYVPGVMIYDTETRKFEFFENPWAVLFRKYYIKDMKHLVDTIGRNINKKYKYIIGVEVPYEIRDVEFKVIPKMETLTLLEAIEEKEDLKEEANVEIEEETLKEENLIVKQEKKDNKGIYAIAGVSAIVVIGGVIAVVKSKKK